ncbi:unnamed protein product [Ectocarpus sp. 13 AM-2016]
MEDWNIEPPETIHNDYAPDCASRAAEGFYVGALYGAVWGVIGRAAYAPTLPSTPAMGDLKPPSGLQAQPTAGLETRGVSRHVRAFGRGAAGYGIVAASTAGVFGVFVGMVNAGTCGCERLRGKKDRFNNAFGGAAAGLSVALLSRHTRTPQMLAAHAAGAAAITSVVAIATGPPVGS